MSRRRTFADREGRHREQRTLRPLLFPDPDVAESTFLGDFFRRETVGGAIALLAAALAVVWANSAWSASYVELRAFVIGPLDVEHWAADGALTLFFFVAGLELKREFTIGSLRKPADAAVPVVAAVCGVAVPALIYLTVNARHPDGVLDGWAIPAATDIAFALAVLAVVGSNLPTALRAFLLTLAVVDDLIVIMIIAIFFTSTCTSWPSSGRSSPSRPGPCSSDSRCVRRSSMCRWPSPPGGWCTRAASTPPSPVSSSDC